MKPDLSARISFYIIGFFVFVAVFASFLSSPYPLLILKNKSTYDIPVSPFFSAYSVQKRIRLDKIDFRGLASKSEISAVFTLVPFSPFEQNLDEILIPPSFSRFGHYMGTDDVGRDVASRMIHGARNSMLVGLIAVALSLVIGVVVGSIAGFYGGWVDLLLSRFIEIMITFPRLILIMAVLVMRKPSLFNVMIVLGLTQWTGVARILRAEFLKRKTFEFVLAAKVLGATSFRQIFYHILPNSLSPVIVMTTFDVADVVLTESALSFLGIGIQPPDASWGQVLNISKSYMDFAWWLIFFPGLFIFLVVVAYNLLGDYLRKYLNPKER
ncbi:MAG: ABC transporter permease [Spirochaetia bacterium]|nr:ABC transporter permease [Spirochaetia bacterium]